MEHEARRSRMKQEELKGCPFCNKEPDIRVSGSYPSSRNLWYIHCCNCDLFFGFDIYGYGDYEGSGIYKTEAELIAAWNKRSPC